MRALLIIASLFSFAQLGLAAPQLGKAAPTFTLSGADGKTYKLSDYTGKIVVLEWFNNECPYVKKHYDSGNMQATQKSVGKDVVWFSVLSSAPGNQGFEKPADAQKIFKDRGSNATALLLDPDGKVGKAYDAKTTPHMFIVDTKGMLAYNGAIDDQPSAKTESLKGAKNFVTAALTEIRAGKTLDAKLASNKPYGCGVKY